MSLFAAAVTATTRCRVGDPNHRPGYQPGTYPPARAHREDAQ